MILHKGHLSRSSRERRLTWALPVDRIASVTVLCRVGVLLYLFYHRRASMIVISNRGPDEWLGTFADPVRAEKGVPRCG